MPKFNPGKYVADAQKTVEASEKRQEVLTAKVEKAQASRDKADERLQKAKDALEAERATAVEAQEFLDARTAKVNAAVAPQGEVVENAEPSPI